ncbi:Very-long-chain (3R)-3-hydroxyacyl-CoA dehydratase PASTICCINO 2A [Vitis vinifera]|uniref:Very-long-chain (3R)-3-hydroxyacyl-CoA dehydratase n=1 Tax=Vitis vinifera TaxID=29760 RepID=A0A438KS22_VITVI|nr:Very-long-chain (3R)-3-hydroxyacyl-CoA dehydratase PASTICCINO 2A [Vitis vinifera]
MAFFSLLRRLYLTIYNWVVFFGWQVTLFSLHFSFSSFYSIHVLESGHQHVYRAVERPLQLAQTAAVLEIFHGLVGLVRSPITATLPQIGSRLYVTWGILWSFPEVQTHVLVSSLVISWSITEANHTFASKLDSLISSLQLQLVIIIRYSFFGVKELLGFAPAWLLWLRYSTFLLLYPTGITSEVGLIYIALPYIKESAKYCLRMPNKWNFSFDYFYAALLVIAFYSSYVPVHAWAEEASSLQIEEGVE